MLFYGDRYLWHKTMKDKLRSLEQNLLKIRNNKILSSETKQEFTRILELYYQNKNTINQYLINYE